MKIVVLDGYALSPDREENPWTPIEVNGEAEIYDRTPKELVLERAKEADILLTNKTVINRETIFSLPKLKYIGVLATGYNIVDIEAAKERGIPVTNVPSYGTDAVAQFSIALLLELCHHAGEHSETVRKGDWARARDYCYWTTPLVELAGKTFGVVGLGAIGRRTAELAHAFGMKILAYAPRPKEPLPYDGFRFCSLEELLAESDVVSLHCPLTPENRGMINAERLGMMKKTAFLINTARGPLIDEEALAQALNEGRIAGAGLDVLSKEPPTADNPLFTAKNAIITPHIAWATLEARRRLMQTAGENITAFLQGTPKNVVNGL